MFLLPGDRVVVLLLPSIRLDFVEHVAGRIVSKPCSRLEQMVDSNACRVSDTVGLQCLTTARSRSCTADFVSDGDDPRDFLLCGFIVAFPRGTWCAAALERLPSVTVPVKVGTVLAGTRRRPPGIVSRLFAGRRDVNPRSRLLLMFDSKAWIDGATLRESDRTFMLLVNGQVSGRFRGRKNVVASAGGTVFLCASTEKIGSFTGLVLAAALFTCRTMRNDSSELAQTCIHWFAHSKATLNFRHWADGDGQLPDEHIPVRPDIL